MKRTLIPLLSLVSIIRLFDYSIIPPASAAVPAPWIADTSSFKPAVFDVVRGETIALEATMQSGGKPFAIGLEPVCIFWQTNGMGSAWWVRPCVATASSPSNPTNVLSATFTPDMDPGAATVNGFLGSSGSIYRAAFTLRFRHGPGATPSALPLPTPVIDFSKVTVLNPPWPTGAARQLPSYLHEMDFDDCYTNEAAWYYAQPQPYAACSAVRDGGFLYRNYDWTFDDAAEFVVRMGAANGRFASVGVANCGTNLTEEIVTSGKWSRYYKCLPGRVVDGINEHGVVAEVNVVDGDPHEAGWPTNGTIHCLGAVRWVLDNATNAASAAMVLAAEVYFPVCWSQNFHWMIADATSTWIVENGTASNVTEVAAKRVMTNFPILPDTYVGTGKERYRVLRGETGDANITNVWFTRAYSAGGWWYSDFNNNATAMSMAKLMWAQGPKESHRGESFDGKPWWQTVHTSVYDITNRTLRVAVQETPDWYTFAVPSAGGVKPEAVREIVEPMVDAATNGLRRVDDMAVYERKIKWIGTDVFGEVGEFVSENPPYPGSSSSYIRDDYVHRLLFKASEGIVYGMISDHSDVSEPVSALDNDGETFTVFMPGWGSVHFTRREDMGLQLTSDRLATTNGVNAAIAGKAEADRVIPYINYDPSIIEGPSINPPNDRRLTFYRDRTYGVPYLYYDIGVFQASGARINLGWWNAVKGQKYLDDRGDFVDETLPQYLASGEWNTADDPFAKVSQLAAKRDLTNNVCAADGFERWSLSYSDGVDHHFDASTIFYDDHTWRFGDYFAYGDQIRDPNATEIVTSASFYGDHMYGITATRSRVAVSNETFVTTSYVTNETAKAKSEASEAVRAETARATAVEDGIIEEISAFKAFDIRVMDELPDEGEVGVIYLVKADDYDTTKTRDEYLWSQDAWRLIGSTRFDSSVIAKTKTTTPIPPDKTNLVSYVNMKEHGGVTLPENEDGAVVIGSGAVGTIDPDYISTITNSTVLRSTSVAIGMNANARRADGKQAQAVAIGWNAKATGGNAIAIGTGAVHWFEDDESGPGAVASGSQSIAISYNAKATAESAIAMGMNAKSRAVNAVQIGDGENTEANSLKFRGTYVVKDGKVQGGVDTNKVEEISREMLEPQVIVGLDEEITVKSHAITTLSPTGYVEEVYVTPTGSRNFEIYVANTAETRERLPLRFDTDIDGEVTRLGPWWTNYVLRLPFKMTSKEPLPKTIILEVEEYDTGWDWTPVVTRAAETNGAVTVEGTNLHFAASALIGGVTLPVKTPRYGVVNLNTNGVSGASGALLGRGGETLCTFTVE